MKEPCKCGALDCPSCGRAQGTYEAHTTQCGKCNEMLADCDCDEPEAIEPDDEEDPDEREYWREQAREEWESDRAADAYEARMERGR